MAEGREDEERGSGEREGGGKGGGREEITDASESISTKREHERVHPLWIARANVRAPSLNICHELSILNSLRTNFLNSYTNSLSRTLCHVTDSP